MKVWDLSKTEEEANRLFQDKGCCPKQNKSQVKLGIIFLSYFVLFY